MTTQHIASPSTGHDRPRADRRADRRGAEGTLLLNLDEVADQLRCTRRNVERLVAAHQIPVVRFGRSVRVERTAVERFVVEHRQSDEFHEPSSGPDR